MGYYQVEHLLVPALGNAVEGQAEAFGFSGPQVAGLSAGDGHALAQYDLAVGVVENTVDFHQLHQAFALIADFAVDLDHRLLQIAFIGLHLDVTQRQILEVAAGLGREYGTRLPSRVAAEQPPRRATHEQDHDRHDG